MISVKWILPVALAVTVSLTGVSAAAHTVTSGTDMRSAIATQKEEALSEKLDSGKISQEKYDEIITAIESDEFAGHRFNFDKLGELIEEKKAEWSAKRAEMLAEKLESGEITQEQYDEIIAAIESGEFAGQSFNFGKFGELTEEQKAEFAAKWSENAQSGRFGCFFGNRVNAKELTDEQKAEIEEKKAEFAEKQAEFAEKQAELAENGGFGAFRGGMHGNFGAHK